MKTRPAPSERESVGGLRRPASMEVKKKKTEVTSANERGGEESSVIQTQRDQKENAKATWGKTWRKTQGSCRKNQIKNLIWGNTSVRGCLGEIDLLRGDRKKCGPTARKIEKGVS